MKKIGGREARNLEAQRGSDAALQNYFEAVGELLIEKPLRRASPGNNLSTVVRAQTLSVLEGLDPDRKRIRPNPDSRSPNANDHRGVIWASSSTAATKPFLDCQRARGRNFP